MPATVLALVAALALVAGAAAEDTTETSTFGADGIAIQNLGTHFEKSQFTSVEARADGGIVAQRSNRLEAYLASGAPDSAFPARQLAEYGRSFPLSGGKRLVVDGYKLTRLNPDGSVDTSFGGGAKASSEVEAAADLPSGQILLAGSSTVGTHVIETRVSIVFLNPNGSTNRDMGKEGGLEIYLPGQGANVVEILPTGDGGALVVGDSFLLRVRADGSPDPAFGSHGLVNDLPLLAGARILPDGGIEAVGSAWESPYKGVFIMRLRTNGARDQSFGRDGVRSFDPAGRVSAHAALWEPDGSVVIGGVDVTDRCSSTENCEVVPLLARFDPSGELDPGFGQGGLVMLDALAAAPGSWLDGGVEALSRRPDGTLIVGGGAAPEQTVAFLAALSPQGALLPDFGEGGVVRVREPVPARQLVAGLACLPGGGLLAVGTADVGATDTAVLVRSAADGSIDRSFGDGSGYAILGDARFGEALAVDAGGRTLVGVYGVPRSKLMLLDPDGAAVLSFGSAGVVELPSRIRVKALAFAPGGDFVLLGNDDAGGNPESGVVLRFHADGKRDTGFGKNGRVDLRPGGREMRASALALDARGRILAAGTAHRRFAMVRLLPGGAPDPSFGSKGWVLPSAGRAWALARGVALARAGSRIYLAGTARNGDPLRLALMKFRSNGSPVAGFAKAGRRTVTVPHGLEPESVIASRGDALVVLNEGPQFSFSRSGKVRRERVVGAPSIFNEVRGVRCGDRVLVGGTGFLPESRHYAYFLNSRALP